MTVREALAHVVEGRDLDRQSAYEALCEVMDGDSTESQIAGLLVALRMKGETPEEIAGLAQAMRDHAVRVTTGRSPLVDTCGTGGDALDTFNISTAAAFVAAGAGAAVAKHGNRSVSSQCGSADVLEALGVRLDLTAEQVGRCLDEIGIGFLFAPSLHPAMKYAAGPRKELGLRTVFNILGPLTNPAGASRQLLGVFDGALVETICRALAELGSEHVLVAHGEPGLDELSTLGPTAVAELVDGDVRTWTIAPQELGLSTAAPEHLAGGDAEESAEVLRAVLEGEPGPRRDIVALNAAGVLLAADLAENLQDGLRLAFETIDSGAAREKLDALRELSITLAETD